MSDTRPATVGDVQRVEDVLGKRMSAVEQDVAEIKTKQAVTSVKYIFLSAVGSSIPVLLSIIIYLVVRGK